MSSTPFLTPAMAWLARQQKGNPLQGHSDRTSAIAALLVPALPKLMHDHLANGTVAIGEIADTKPDVRTIPLEDGNFVVLVNSGLMDFVYAVCHGVARITTTLGDEGTPDTSADAVDPLQLVAADIARLFKEWRRHHSFSFFFRRPQIKHATFAITPNILELTETLAKLTEMFILGHELGHVALDREEAPHLDPNTELSADAIGFVYYIEAARHAPNLRFAFAAAVLAVRIIAGLERSGVPFSTQYPPQRQRVDKLHSALSALCSSRQSYHEITTIAVAYESMMDHIDDLIAGVEVPGTSYPDAGRMLGFLIGALEELAKGSLPQETFVADVERRARLVPPDVVHEAAAALCDYYVTHPYPQDTYIPKDIRSAMGSALKRVVPKLPHELKSAFPLQ